MIVSSAEASRTSGSARVLAADTLSTAHIVVTPGDTITSEAGYLRGHGTYVEKGELVASVAGVVERINQLVSVRPMNARYTGEVGDVVVGRVQEVGSRRWKVDINARQDAVLLLSSINLTGGVQRRRTVQDQLQMRQYFAENDLISADVHSFYGDGAMLLHARSLKYGKLENGQLIVVPPALVMRCKQHFVTLPCGVDIILGNNGYVWASETVPDSELKTATEDAAAAGLAKAVEAKRKYQASRATSKEGRIKMCRVRNAINALSSMFLSISPQSIMDVYDESIKLKLEPKAMLSPKLLGVLTDPARARAQAAAEEAQQAKSKKK